MLPIEAARFVGKTCNNPLQSPEFFTWEEVVPTGKGRVERGIRIGVMSMFFPCFPLRIGRGSPRRAVAVRSIGTRLAIEGFASHLTLMERYRGVEHEREKTT